MSTDNNFNDILPSEFRTAGKVNFNTSAKSDYATNEAFKTLRSNLLFCGTNIKTILITSTLENEGKSTVSTELAKSLAEINKKTLLIDADMRRSTILPRNLKTQNILGLAELLSGQATIEQVLYNTQEPNFDVIFSCAFPPNPVELLNSDFFDSIMEKFKKVYDYIIIDSPPLGLVIDAAVISSRCDGAIMIITPDKTHISEALGVKEQLTKSGCKILGAVINETNPKHKDKSRTYKSRNYYYTATQDTQKRFSVFKKK